MTVQAPDFRSTDEYCVSMRDGVLVLPEICGPLPEVREASASRARKMHSLGRPPGLAGPTLSGLAGEHRRRVIAWAGKCHSRGRK